MAETELQKEKVKSLMDLFSKHNHFGNAQGVEFKILEDERIELKMLITQNHLSSPNTAHGGAISGYMDSVLGVNALYKAFCRSKICSTVEFKINFIRPVQLGETLIGRATIDYQGQTLMVVSGEISGLESGEIKAKGLGTFNLYPMEKKDFLKQILNEETQI